MDCCVANALALSEPIASSSSTPPVTVVPPMLRLLIPATTPPSSVTPSTFTACPTVAVIVKALAPAELIPLAFRVISSTVKVVSAPRLVMLGCAAVVTVAAVPDVLPVTLPVRSAVTTPSLINVPSMVTPAPAVVSLIVSVVIASSAVTTMSVPPVLLPFASISDSSLFAPVEAST